MASLKIKNATKKYDDLEVIHGIDLDIQDGEFCVFVGPSGCGKSTLLRMISGLEDVTSGAIHIGEKDVTSMHPADRGIAMVFQSYALYPHMTVRENMGFGLKMSKVPSNEIDQKVNEAASILHLEEYLDRKPKTLSGGQRQRIAIARALAVKPNLIVCDEPTSALDVSVQAEILNLLTDLRTEHGLTYVMVSHDLSVVGHMCEKLAVMKDGEIVEIMEVETLRKAQASHPYSQELLAASI